jgi:protein gp37
MAEQTSIEWCDHTFNPWTGCTKVSPGCKTVTRKHCGRGSATMTSGDLTVSVPARRSRIGGSR